MADQGGDNVVIRTMKDDFAGGGNTPKSPMLTSPPAAKPTAPAPESPPGPPPTLPLPPRPVATAAPLVPAPFGGTPNVTRRNRRRWLVWAGGAAVLLAIVGGSAWAFVTFVSAPTTSPEETLETPTSAVGDLMPTSTGLAVYYSLGTPADRTGLLELWQNSPKTLLQGNPKTLLSDPKVEQFMYVGIPGEPRPFLLVPKEQVSQLIREQLSPEQVSEKSGWYIFHSLNASPYVQALAQGSGLGSEMDGRLKQKTAGRPLHIYLSELALNQIRASSAGEVFATGSVRRVLLSAGLGSGQVSLSFEGFGEGSSQPSPSAAAFPPRQKADQALLAAIPADVSFVRLGANFASDLTNWESFTHAIDKSILEQSAPAAFVKQFTGPYAYYQRLGADGLEDVALLVTIPPEMTSPLALGDATLEQAVPALIPLILPIKPVSLPAFADGTYEKMPLRFANLVGSAKALDYAIQNNLIMLATSKEGMLSALDVAASKVPALDASSPWQGLLSAWGAIPVTPELFLGYLNFSSLLDLLPTSQTKLPVGLTQERAGSGLHLTGVLIL